MKCVISNEVVLSQVPEGPFEPYLVSFAEFISAQGYTLYSIHRHVFLATSFSLWLKHKGVELRCITSDHPRQYLRYRTRQIKLCRGDAAALRHLLDFLRGEGVIPSPKATVLRLTPIEHCTQAYEQYLRDVRNLVESTILNYAPFIHCFLKACFKNGPVKLSRLCARDVVRFLQQQAPRLHMKRAKVI